MSQFSSLSRSPRPRVAAHVDSPPPPNLGYVDELSAYHAAGWGFDPTMPGSRIVIEALLGTTGEVLHRAIADVPVAGLAALGVGDGAHGFNMRFPRPLSEAETATLILRPAGYPTPLERSQHLVTKFEPISYVIMDIVDNCNLRCPFCVYDYRTVFKTNMMSEATIDAAARLAPFVTEGGFWFSCLHEPTMHPRLMDYVYKVPEDHRHKLFYTSNLARRMPDAYFAALADIGMHHVNISIESLEPSIYERMRKGARYPIFRENWDRLIAAFAVGKAPPRLRYICLAYKSNVRELPALVDYLFRERRAAAVEVRHTYDMAHIPQKFRQDEYLFRDDWLWLRDSLAHYPSESLLIDLPPGVTEDGFDEQLRRELGREVPPPAQPPQTPESADIVTDPAPEGYQPGRYGMRLFWDGRLEVNRLWADMTTSPPREVRLATMNVRDIGDPLAFLRRLPV